MITRIRPAHWAASRLVLLALAAVSAAMLVSSLARSRLSLAGRPVRTATSPETRPAPARPLSDYQAMTRRNVFAAPPASDGPAAVTGPVATAPASLRLVGTGRRGGQRFAIVEDLVAHKQLVVSPGDSLGGGKVSRIGWRSLVLQRAGADELLAVDDPPAATIADASHLAPIATPAVSPGGISDDQVKKIGDDRYLVAQSEVDESLANLSDLITQLRAVPNQEGGRTNGFKVFAIQRGSLFQKIGLENNDVVQRVNGIDLNDPTRAMAVLQELQGQTKLSVDVMRGSETRTLTYEIR